MNDKTVSTEDLQKMLAAIPLHIASANPTGGRATAMGEVKLTREPHPEDECVCGDYRRDHVDGVGRCRMPDDLTHANQPCFSFRLAFPNEGPGSREALRDMSGEAPKSLGLSHVFVHAKPKPPACDHDFQGWREFEDGNGGEQVCTKCGMGAMAHTLSLDF